MADVYRYLMMMKCTVYNSIRNFPRPQFRMVKNKKINKTKWILSLSLYSVGIWETSRQKGNFYAFFDFWVSRANEIQPVQLVILLRFFLCFLRWMDRRRIRKKEVGWSFFFSSFFNSSPLPFPHSLAPSFFPIYKLIPPPQNRLFSTLA